MDCVGWLPQRSQMAFGGWSYSAAISAKSESRVTRRNPFALAWWPHGAVVGFGHAEQSEVVRAGEKVG